MAPRLVLVHGIGGPRQADLERQCWAAALAEGAHKAGHSAAADQLIDGTLADVRYAYYGDLFRPRQAQGDGDGELDAAEADLLAGLLDEIIGEHRGEPNVDQQHLDRALARLQPQGQPQGTMAVVKRAADAATTLLDAGPWRDGGQWISGKLMIGDLAQVARYLARREADPAGHPIDQRIRAIVTEAIGPEPAVVIAHSLGTVVSFEALHEHVGDIPLWVTLGSPLALRSVVWPKLQPKPPATPPRVRRWLNYWDRDDIVATRPILENSFLPNDDGVLPDSSRVDSDGVSGPRRGQVPSQSGRGRPGCGGTAEARGGRMTSSRRHVLVIASQNEAMGHLDQLDKVAAELGGVLRDSEIGACSPGLSSGEWLLTGEVTTTAITTAITSAVRYAAEKRATLVLALLGHGFTPDNYPQLYYMGCDSRNQVPLEAVNVRELLGGAAEQPGIKAVITLIDTCTAAAAIPANLAAGTQGGKAGLVLLMASPVATSAYDLGMSKELIRLLKSGVAGADTTLRLEVVGPRIQAALDAQDIRGFSYPGDYHAEPMWLAYNRQADSALTTGSFGDAELAAALRALPAPQQLPGNIQQLRELREELRARLHQQPGIPGSGLAAVDLSRAVRVTDSLIAAHQTAALLRGHLRDALDDTALRRALVIASGTLDTVQAKAALSVTDAAELAALRYRSRREPDCLPQLARLVVALVDGAGLDPARSELKDEWTASVGRVEAYNDALSEHAAHSGRRRFGLVVSYDALAGEWPLGIRAWVVYGGRECGKNDEIRCTADQAGAENALVEAVSWAEQQAAGLGEELDRIEIAMPAARLLDWHPEKVKYNGTWLGVHYDVLPRWSRRLEPTKEMRGYNSNVRRHLDQIPGLPKNGRLHWLDATEVSDQATLLNELAMGRYAPASALTSRPAQPDGPSLVDLLLMYLPIVLWPQGASLSPAHRQRVVNRWKLLPDAFLIAYRARWARAAQIKPDLIADIQAVWDDEDWLRFCGTAGA